MNTNKRHTWLPTSAKEVKRLGWESIDVILFSGDAYVDHPSFGAAVIGRILEKAGLKVAIVPQPNWRDDLRDFKKLGKPNLFFGVTAGNMDSMVNHYTANKRRRSNDAYTPAGTPNQRPDYATIVYCKIVKELYPDVPLIIGGIEASLRRFTHYDYWSDKLMPSILIDSKADLLFYGMAEKSITQYAEMVKKGIPHEKITTIPQTVFTVPINEQFATQKEWQKVELASHKNCLKNKITFANNFKIIEEESNKIEQKQIIQPVDNQLVVANPAWIKTEQKEIDDFFNLPYTRLPHPRYNNKKPIPAYEMIKHSVNIHRGCFGGCSFCTISAHQGKFIISRSQESILKEVQQITEMQDFKGYISDLGGPSANMYQMRGKDLSICQKCRRASCIFPNICKNLNNSHQPMINLYQKVRKMPKIKKAFVSSGVRYDMIFDNTKNTDNQEINKNYFRQLLKHHVSGRLKVAPEHTSDDVLNMMRKPTFELFKKMNKEFKRIDKEEKLNQQLIPYFISSHPRFYANSYDFGNCNLLFGL